MNLHRQVFSIPVKTHAELAKFLRQLGRDKVSGVLTIAFRSGGICTEPELAVRAKQSPEPPPGKNMLTG